MFDDYKGVRQITVFLTEYYRALQVLREGEELGFDDLDQ